MLYRYVLPFITAAATVCASPIAERAPAGITDTVILQYALTLEHLENVFYMDALSKFDQSTFMNAGYPAWVRNRFQQISNDESSHVAFLSGALGSSANAACTYSFPYTDVSSFISLAAVIENVGVSAYLGSAADISEPGYITAAGSILTTESRHQAWIQAAVNMQNPWSSPYDTPLKYAGVFTIASAFITSCPSTNVAFPFQAFPSALTATSVTPGQMTQLTYDDSTTSEKYLIVYYGLSITAVPINADKTVMLPGGLQGTSYAVVSTSNNTTMVAPTTVIAGPLILVNVFNSATENPNPPNAGQ